MRLRSVTKKLLKLKKGGGRNSPSKPSSKQNPNRPAAFPVDTKEFTYGDVHKPITEQIIYGLQDGKIVPIEHNKLDSNSANMEGVPTTELLKKLRAKTAKMIKKDKMKKLKITRKPYTYTGTSPEIGFTDEQRKEVMRTKKLSGPKTRKSHSSRSSERSIETGFARY